MADTHEDRLAAYELEFRAKYTSAEIEEMGKKGHAFKNEDGSYSYPIGDEEDLKNAIHAVGRGNSDHDAIRKYIMGRAKDLGADVLIPSNWNSDGSLEGADEEKSNTVPATAIRADYRGTREERISPRSQFELREVPNGTGGTNLRFTGFACVTEAEYEMEDWLGPWTESVSIGSFAKTLSDGADVAFLLNHTGMTLARTKPGTLKLSEESDGTSSPIYSVTGLHSEALLDPSNPQVAAMRSAVDRGDLDEMSFAFRVLRQEWNNDYTRRWINEVSLDKGDVSLVNYGANPTTGGTVSMRQRLGIRREPLDLRRVVFRIVELREGKTISSDTMDSLQEVLDLIDSSDTNVDNALIKLSALMGVTNPDIAQDAALDRDAPDDDLGDNGEDDDEDAPGLTETYALDDTDFEYRLRILRRKGEAA